MRLRFSDCVLDLERLELTRGGVAVDVEPQVFELIAHLAGNPDRVVGVDELFDVVWRGRIVSLSTLTSRVSAARAAIGDTGGAQRLVRTIHGRGYRFVGAVQAEGAAPAAALPPLHQEVQFCAAADGVRLAWSRVGAGPAIVKTGNWLTHVEYDWESPVWSHVLRWLAEGRRLVRYDARGNGLSDREVADISFEAFVRDLETVVDAAGLERFALFGVSQGCAFSIAYAVRHPERVSKLVLYGGFARGRRLRGSPVDAEQAEAMLTLMRTGWGQDNPAFRQVFTSLFVPGGTPEQMAWFNELQRVTTSPENAVRLRLVSDWMDVVGLLPLVRTPTLVLHCHDDAMQPFEEGRFLAASIPGARFVGLDGRNHLILEADPGWPRLRREVDAFLAE
ncbi:alpha/beta fold hydrolase [Amaricoccus sp.]|uniref:alpha/beta fold hydrolase n=1 Tax=Amaricoccus sp. TaxID=1872485 RepID=UPI001B580F5D|nr:alpha/beta fold hydrolase [Amaricoccus sp.]MBP7001649.1 alpha/beta fold hydrolase [Amaricoccus sp.]